MREKATLLPDLPRYRIRRGSGQLETIKEPYRDEPQAEQIRLPPPPCVPAGQIRLPPPPCVPRAQAVRPSIREVDVERDTADVQVKLDAPLTPFSTVFPVHGLVAPSMCRSEAELNKVVAATHSVSAQTAPLTWTERRELGIARLLIEDLFAADWWIMSIPAVLFAVQNNLLCDPSAIVNGDPR